MITKIANFGFPTQKTESSSYIGANQSTKPVLATQPRTRDTFQRQISFGMFHPQQPPPRHQENALHLAVDNYPKKVISAIARQHPEYLEQRDAKGRTPLLRAAKHHNVEHAEALVEHGADLTARDYTGQNILHYAVIGAGSHGHLDTLRYFLTSPAVKLHEADDYGFTPRETVLSLAPEDSLYTASVIRFLSDHGG